MIPFELGPDQKIERQNIVPEPVDYIATSQDQDIKICSAFRVPHLLQSADSSTTKPSLITGSGKSQDAYKVFNDACASEAQVLCNMCSKMYRNMFEIKNAFDETLSETMIRIQKRKAKRNLEDHDDTSEEEDGGVGQSTQQEQQQPKSHYDMSAKFSLPGVVNFEMIQFAADNGLMEFDIYRQYLAGEAGCPLEHLRDKPGDPIGAETKMQSEEELARRKNKAGATGKIEASKNKDLNLPARDVMKRLHRRRKLNDEENIYFIRVDV